MVGKKFNLMAVVSDFRAGGAEKIVIELLLRLKETFNVSAVCIRDKGEHSNILEEQSIKIHLSYFKGRIHPQSLFNFASLLRRENIHIVHTHMYRPNISGSIGAYIARVPVIISHIHSIHQWDSKRQIFMDRLTSWVKDKIIAVSGEVKNSYIEKVKAGSEKVEVIYSGVEPQKYKVDKKPAELRSIFNIKDGIPVIGIVARLAPEKDHITFLEAAKIVLKTCHNAMFLIVGKGPEENNIKAHIERFNLRDNVVVAGYRMDIPQVLNLLDIFVLSSVREGFPISILEAMATGKPVVATDVGGNREAVVDGETGFIVPKKDSSSLALRILTLIENPRMAAVMGQKGYKRVCQKFSMETMVNETTKLYFDLLAKKRVRPA